MHVCRLQPCVEPATVLLAAAWKAHLKVVHTLEAHKPDLSDLHPAKLKRGKGDLHIGDKGGMGRILIRGEKGNGILDELAPIEVGTQLSVAISILR